MNLCYEIKACEAGLRDLSQPLFARLDLSQKYRLEAVLCGAMPILYLPEGGARDVAEAHAACARALMASRRQRCVIAVDEDGALQRSLSPRFFPQSLEARFDLLKQTFLAVKELMDEVWVLLAVEELAPGGLDATDGVAIARALADLGLKTIIATAGTKDFMPLYDRRATARKDPSREGFHSNEPALASALWLVQNTELSVWCLAFLDDDEKALNLAKTLGLSGLIKKKRYDKV